MYFSENVLQQLNTALISVFVLDAYGCFTIRLIFCFLIFFLKFYFMETIFLNFFLFDVNSEIYLLDCMFFIFLTRISNWILFTIRSINLFFTQFYITKT